MSLRPNITLPTLFFAALWLGLATTQVSHSGEVIPEGRHEESLVHCARDFVTEDGLKASAGSDLILYRQDGKWKWHRIALSEDCVLNGIPFKKGTLLVRSWIGTEVFIRAYDGPKHFKGYLGTR